MRSKNIFREKNHKKVFIVISYNFEVFFSYIFA